MGLLGREAVEALPPDLPDEFRAAGAVDQEAPEEDGRGKEECGEERPRSEGDA